MTKTTELAKLREPFPPSVVGKLPRNVSKDGPKSKCNICGGYHGPAAIHLDYVGHAEVTDRLLSVDPEWSWEPFSLDERGLPAFILNQQGQPIGLWIWLTVCGVRRPGYGSVEAGKFDAVKELIGDALRNAAMRFGVALDLWAKFDLESQVSPQESQATPPSETSPAPADSGPEIGSGATDVATAAAEAPQAGPVSDPGPASPPSDEEQLEAEDILRALKDWVGGNDSKHSRVRAEVAKICLEQNVPPPDLIANASLPVLRAVASVLLTKENA